VPLIFDDRLSFSELLGRARDELHWNSNEDAISVQGLLHYGKSDQTFGRQERECVCGEMCGLDGWICG
jgi:hypothetical protein